MIDPKASASKRLLHLLQDNRGLVLFLLVMFVFRSAVADWNHVPSGSMVPSILVGDRILVNKMAYSLRIPFTLQPLAEFAPPQRGDVATFESPTTEQLLVKRVIGIPGDTVQMHHNVLTINGQAASYSANPKTIDPQLLVAAALSTGAEVTLLQETLLEKTIGSQTHQIALANSQPANARHSFEPIIVPPNQYLMLGDNRDFSADSRVIGLIHRRQIVGRAHTIAFSFDLDALRPRGDRFFKALK